MFPNEKARLMRMMDSNGIPTHNEAGMQMDFTQRVEWLIEHANQQMRAIDPPLACPDCGELPIIVHHISCQSLMSAGN